MLRIWTIFDRIQIRLLKTSRSGSNFWKHPDPVLDPIPVQVFGSGSGFGFGSSSNFWIRFRFLGPDLELKPNPEPDPDLKTGTGIRSRTGSGCFQKLVTDPVKNRRIRNIEASTPRYVTQHRVDLTKFFTLSGRRKKVFIWIWKFELIVKNINKKYLEIRICKKALILQFFCTLL
jgi:hypothetical protein